VCGKETLERELKFTVDETFDLSTLGELASARSFLSVYHDSGDHRLARAGITLRRRLENGANLWQLKLPRGADARLEIERPGGPAAPPAELRNALAAVLRAEPLREVGRLRTGRQTVRDDGVEIVLDEVAVLDGRRVVSSFRELEVEATDDRGDGLGRLAKRLTRAGAVPTDGRPKVLQALGLDFRREPPAAKAPAGEHIRAMLAAQVDAIHARDPAVRLLDDPEDLHQLRVAVRRFRAVLRAARPVLDESWSEPLRAELDWLGGLLGTVRDLDVLIEQLEADAVALEPADRKAFGRALAALATERRTAREAMLQGLATDRYVSLVERLVEAAEAPHLCEEQIGVADLAADEFRRLRKAAKAVTADAPDEELHRLRIRGKRARYAAELAEVAAGKEATRFVRAAKEFQDVIGAHQDAVVAEERLRALLATGRSVHTGFAIGRVVEWQRARKRASREAYPDAWRRLERAGRRAWG